MGAQERIDKYPELFEKFKVMTTEKVFDLFMQQREENQRMQKEFTEQLLKVQEQNIELEQKLSRQEKKKKYVPKKSYGKFAFSSEDEVKLFLNRMRQYDYTMYVYCILGVNLGLRNSEILNFKFNDIKQYVESYRVRLENKKNPFSFYDKKTGKFHQVFFTDATLEVIEDYLARVEKNEIFNTDGFDFDRDDLQFLLKKNGEKLEYFNVDYAFKTINKKYYGNVKGFNSHLLRRTFVTLNIKRGIPTAKISKYVNHANEQQTLEYACFTDEDNKELMLSVQ